MNISFLLSDLYSLGLLILAVVCFVVLALHYGLVYWRVGRYKHKCDAEEPAPAGNLPSVSVVLVAHNAADWMRENLVYLLEQDYPKPYEVVVVDYQSSDDTEFVLKVCAEGYNHLKVVSLPHDVNMFQGKKFPLSMGIKSAKYDVVVLTEPDCVTTDFGWLASMTRNYSSPRTQMVLGYCGIRKEKGLMNLMQRYENMSYSADYFARALNGLAETGCGRNLSYKKDFFYKKGAFTRMYTEEYGEDDLFVNQNAAKGNTAVCVDKHGWMMTDAQKSFRKWHQLRRERVATRRWHSLGERLRRVGVKLSVLGFYAALVLMILLHPYLWPLALGLFVVKNAWQIVAVWSAGKAFEMNTLCWWSPLMEIYFLFADTILAISPLPKKNSRR